MDADTTSSLLSSLVCLAPFCLGILGLAGVAALFVWIIRRQSQPKDETTLAEERVKARPDLERLVASLQPWSPSALADLSTDWDARWTKFGRTLSARGTIPSLSEPKGPALVAFVLKVRGARKPDGQLLARTGDRAFAFRLAVDGVRVETDGVLLGSVQPDGTLLDAGGRLLGSAPRPGGLPARFSLGTLSRIRDEREPSYPVTLGERVVARLANPPVQMTNVISLKKQQYAPAVVLETMPGEEEATWLLALAILQVAGYNLLETIWTN